MPIDGTATPIDAISANRAEATASRPPGMPGRTIAAASPIASGRFPRSAADGRMEPDEHAPGFVASGPASMAATPIEERTHR
jgi:hypothetical protein